MRLILVRGLPGSGKSTYAKSLDILHLEADMFCMMDGEYKWDPKRIGYTHSMCLQMTKEALEAGCDVVVSNTFTTMKELKPYITLALTKGAEFSITRMEGEYGSVHNVPKETIEKMKLRFADIDGEETIGK